MEDSNRLLDYDMPFARLPYYPGSGLISLFEGNSTPGNLQDKVGSPDSPYTHSSRMVPTFILLRSAKFGTWYAHTEHF